MDDLTRFARRLVEQLSATREGANQQVLVRQVRDKLLPYRTHRRALQLESVEDYETVLLRLVAGERGFVRTQPASAARRCQEELAGANPDLAVLDEVADSTNQFTSLAAAQVVGDDGQTPVVMASEATPADVPRVLASEAKPAGARVMASEAKPSGRTGEIAPMAVPARAPTPTSRPSDAMSTGCPHCSKPIPANRQVVFCPWCGDRLVPFACPRCKTELDSAWQHCITCGAPVKDPHRYD